MVLDRIKPYCIIMADKVRFCSDGSIVVDPLFIGASDVCGVLCSTLAL